MNSPQTIRALILAKQSLESTIKSTNRKAALPQNAGKPWTEDQDRELLAQFDSGNNISQISELHARTRGSIPKPLDNAGFRASQVS